MKLRTTTFLVAVFVTATLISSATAAPIKVLGLELGTGVDPAGPWEYSTVPGLVGVEFTKLSLADFATVALSDYDVLYVGELFRDGRVTVAGQEPLDALNARAGDIDAFVLGGGGILALPEPIGVGRWQWIPAPVRPNFVNDFISDDTVRIVDLGHPVMAGLSDAGLSGWNTSSHGWFQSTPGLDVLVDNGDGRPITFAGEYGMGRLVLTDQDADFHNQRGNHSPDQLRFIQNAIDWLARDAHDVPSPGTVWLVLGGLAVVYRRFALTR